jgi:hypothetical protein
LVNEQNYFCCGKGQPFYFQAASLAQFITHQRTTFVGWHGERGTAYQSISEREGQFFGL